MRSRSSAPRAASKSYRDFGKVTAWQINKFLLSGIGAVVGLLIN